MPRPTIHESESDALTAQADEAVDHANDRLDSQQIASAGSPDGHRPRSRGRAPVEDQTDEAAATLEAAKLEAAKRAMQDARDVEERRRVYQDSHNKVALGMLSSRFQRFEVGVTGEQRGPTSLVNDPSLGGVSKVSPRGNRAQLRAEAAAAEARGADGEYARYFPSHHAGQLTSRPELERLARKRAGQTHHQMNAAKPPLRFGIPITAQSLELCKQLGIGATSLLREAPTIMGAIAADDARRSGGGGGGGGGGGVGGGGSPSSVRSDSPRRPKPPGQPRTPRSARSGGGKPNTARRRSASERRATKTARAEAAAEAAREAERRASTQAEEARLRREVEEQVAEMVVRRNAEMRRRAGFVARQHGRALQLANRVAREDEAHGQRQAVQRARRDELKLVAEARHRRQAEERKQRREEEEEGTEEERAKKREARRARDSEERRAQHEEERQAREARAAEALRAERAAEQQRQQRQQAHASAVAAYDEERVAAEREAFERRDAAVETKRVGAREVLTAHTRRSREAELHADEVQHEIEARAEAVVLQHEQQERYLEQQRLERVRRMRKLDEQERQHARQVVERMERREAARKERTVEAGHAKARASHEVQQAQAEQHEAWVSQQRQHGQLAQARAEAARLEVEKARQAVRAEAELRAERSERLAAAKAYRDEQIGLVKAELANKQARVNAVLLDAAVKSVAAPLADVEAALGEPPAGTPGAGMSNLPARLMVDRKSRRHAVRANPTTLPSWDSPAPASHGRRAAPAPVDSRAFSDRHAKRESHGKELLALIDSYP